MNRLNISFLWIVFSFPSIAHAELMSEKVFGKWERVTVAEIKKPVPEFQYGGGSFGSIQKKPVPVVHPKYCNERQPDGSYLYIRCGSY